MSCGCGGDATIITGGDGIEVTGSGLPNDPLVINRTADVILKAQDTSTIDLDMVGSGTTADPYLLEASVTANLEDLLDVQSGTVMVDGYAPIWTGGTHFELKAPPLAAPGAVTVTTGLLGDGSAPDPIKVAVSEAVVDSTGGLYVYADTAGELRAERPIISSIAWSIITGKPSTFTPSAHTHTNADLTGILSGTASPSSGLGVDGALYAQYT